MNKITSQHRINQINKITNYALKFLNVDVVFMDPKDLGSISGGYECPRGQELAKITISNDYNGLTTILIMLHELGHHIDYLKRGNPADEDNAYQYYPEVRGASCPIKYRKLIRKTEDEAIRHAYELAVMLDLKLPSFQYLKDELFTKQSLEMVLRNGPMTREEIQKLKKKCAKQAKKLLAEKYENKKTLPLPNKL